MNDKEKLQSVIELLTRLADNIDKTECVLKKTSLGFLTKGNIHLTINFYSQIVKDVEGSVLENVNVLYTHK